MNEGLLDGFELFARRGRGRTGERKPMVTIQRGGLFGLNSAAYEALGRPKYVTYFYAPRDHLMAIQGTDDTGAGYRVRSSPGSGATVNGRAFTKYYEILTTVSRRYPAEMQDGKLVVDIKVPGTIVTRDGRKAAKSD